MRGVSDSPVWMVHRKRKLHSSRVRTSTRSSASGSTAVTCKRLSSGSCRLWLRDRYSMSAIISSMMPSEAGMRSANRESPPLV
jgi:hypothetical protein